MSLTGTDGGLIIREYDAQPGFLGHPGGVVLDTYLAIDPDGATGSGEVVAQPCLAADLGVDWTNANEPTPHQVLKLTNHSAKAMRGLGESPLHPGRRPAASHLPLGAARAGRWPG